MQGVRLAPKARAWGTMRPVSYFLITSVEHQLEILPF
jgi:hypothetical protein